METDVASTHGVAILEDVEVGDKAVVVLIAFRGIGGVFDERGDLILKFSNGASKSSNLRGMLQGMGLDGEGQTMDKLS